MSFQPLTRARMPYIFATTFFYRDSICKCEHLSDQDCEMYKYKVIAKLLEK